MREGEIVVALIRLFKRRIGLQTGLVAWFGSGLCGLSVRPVVGWLSQAVQLSGQLNGCAAYFALDRRYRHEIYLGILAAWQLRHAVLALAAKAKRPAPAAIAGKSHWLRLMILYTS